MANEAFPNLRSASADVRADREAVLVAVRRNGLALQHASESLRADREVVLVAVRETGLALQYASESLLGDRCVVSAAMQRSATLMQQKATHFPNRTDLFFQYAEEDCFGFLATNSALNTNKVVMLEAVKTYGWALQFASDSLRADRDVVLEAIKQDGTALRFANVMFRAEREVVMKAVKQHGGALEHAGDFRQDREVALAAVRQRGAALRFASKELRSDLEVVLEAVKHPGWALMFASESLRSNEEVVRTAVKLHAESLRHASKDLQCNKDLVLLAIRSWPLAPGPIWETRRAGLVWASVGATLDLGPDSMALLDEPRFRRVKSCLLAVEGEDAPVVSVQLSRSNGPKGSAISCIALLLSGASFSFEMKSCSLLSRRWLSRRRPDPTVNDLAKMLLENLRTCPELGDSVKSAKRVFINFLPAGGDGDDNGDAVAVTPWDFDRPLADFLLSPGPEQVAEPSSNKAKVATATCDHRAPLQLVGERAGEAEQSPISAPPALPHRCLWRCLVPSLV